MPDPPTPDPADYGISPKYGFLSPDPPAVSFLDEYYTPWDDLIRQLPSLIATNTLKKQISQLPLLEITNLKNDPQHRRAYVLLAFLIHSSIWHTSPPDPIIPLQLSEPFLDICAHLRIPPVLSYAGLCVWNWRVRDGGGMELENMETLASFTGTRGEAAFYHVPVLIEAEGGHLMHLLLDAIDAARDKRSEVVREALDETTGSLVRMAGHLSKFYGVLEPEFFYHDLRPFLAGGKGMEDKGLPEGVVFRRSDGKEEAFKLAGGSAAMSSLVPFIDLALGVVHEDRTVFDEMKAYMPGPHRDFLDAVARIPSLRSFVEAHPDDAALTTAYNDCLAQLKSWRGKHIAIVSKYIVQPAREAEKAARVEKLEISGPEGGDEDWELQGTGGSALIPFLRQAKDDTRGIQAN